MFEKLLSVLPYTPGISHQMAFYARRMREESLIRRTGLIFMILTFMVQFFAVLNPPQPASAASDNDLINGGIKSRSEAVNACRDNLRHFGDIMEYYGIRCKDIAEADKVVIKSTAHDRNLYSMGRKPYGKKGETAVNLPGPGKKFYWRYLWSWDTGGASSYEALKFRSGLTGKTFWILFDCGNLVSINLPKPVETELVFKPTPQPQTPPTITPIPTPTPTPTPPKPVTPTTPSVPVTPKTPNVNIRKTAANVTQGLPDANNSVAKPDDVITYTLYAQNTGSGAANNYVFEENLSDVLDYALASDFHGGRLDSDNIITWPAVNIAAGQTAKVQVTVKVRNPLPAKPAAAGDPGHFDMIMTNVYGNTININLPAPAVQTVQTAAATLPNTGPGTGLFIALVVVVGSAYFYARTRLLAKESALAVQESAAV